MIRVGVIGAAGKMGREVCRAVLEDPELNLVAAVDVQGNGMVGELIGGDSKVKLSDELDTLSDAEVEVAVDFTHPSSVMGNLRYCIRHAIHAVVGTTGITAENLAEIERLIDEEGGECNVVVAPNFAIGAVLMMRFAEEAVRFLPDVEIVELHHGDKPDAPSGTSIATARRIAAALGADASAAPGDERVAGARGANVDGVRIHSVRLPGLVAHQEVILGGMGQTLSVRHDSTSHTSFMPGVLMAVRAVASRPGLTFGLESLLA